MINTLRGSNRKSKQRARNNGQCKEKGENSKKESKEKKTRQSSEDF